MKKIILFVTVCLFPLFISAQSIENNGVNPFTGDSICVTSWSNIAGESLFPYKEKSNYSFMLRKVNNTIFFHLRLYSNSNNINKIDKDSKLQLKMRDGSLITLIAIDNFTANTYVYTYLENTNSSNIIHAVYTGDLSDMANNNLIEKIGIDTAWGAWISELNEKNAKKVTKAYNLIMQN